MIQWRWWSLRNQWSRVHQKQWCVPLDWTGIGNQCKINHNSLTGGPRFAEFKQRSTVHKCAVLCCAKGKAQCRALSTKLPVVGVISWVCTQTGCYASFKAVHHGAEVIFCAVQHAICTESITFWYKMLSIKKWRRAWRIGCALCCSASALAVNHCIPPWMCLLPVGIRFWCKIRTRYFSRLGGLFTSPVCCQNVTFFDVPALHWALHVFSWPCRYGVWQPCANRCVASHCVEKACHGVPVDVLTQRPRFLTHFHIYNIV